MQLNQNVFLVGPMGAGKTTIGRMLAEDLKFEFFDSDKVIVDKAGADIPWIFDIEGEAGFRTREQEAIDELTQEKNIVLATGGGAILSAENRKCLRSRGVVVYLKTSIRQQLFRTEKDRSRPLLLSGDRKKTLTDLMGIRGPLYENTADLTVSTDRLNPKNITKSILEYVEKKQWETN